MEYRTIPISTPPESWQCRHHPQPVTAGILFLRIQGFGVHPTAGDRWSPPPTPGFWSYIAWFQVCRFLHLKFPYNYLSIAPWPREMWIMRRAFGKTYRKSAGKPSSSASEEMCIMREHFSFDSTRLKIRYLNIWIWIWILLVEFKRDIMFNSTKFNYNSDSILNWFVIWLRLEFDL